MLQNDRKYNQQIAYKRQRVKLGRQENECNKNERHLFKTQLTAATKIRETTTT